MDKSKLLRPWAKEKQPLYPARTSYATHNLSGNLVAFVELLGRQHLNNWGGNYLGDVYGEQYTGNPQFYSTHEEAIAATNIILVREGYVIVPEDLIEKYLLLLMTTLVCAMCKKMDTMKRYIHPDGFGYRMVPVGWCAYYGANWRSDGATQLCSYDCYEKYLLLL